MKYILLIITVVVLSACGGGSEGGPDDTIKALKLPSGSINPANKE